MEYMIMAIETPEAFAAREDPARVEAYWASWNGYLEALTAAGVLQSGAGLRAPETSTTVRLREGQRLVQDGPYAGTKEQLGGIFIIDVPDLDAALQWAARCPAAADGAADVRPLLQRPM